MTTTTERVFQIFKELNQIPRPSHHEERVADYLCRFAERLNLPYKRDKENCVVISKPATQGHEGAEPVVLLNHMDMVCVGMNDPLNMSIDAYIENGWMKARGTSLGADNGIGLSMALAVLESNEMVHGPLEVMTTTNEEDGMSGASQLSSEFLKGRKVINLDSEDYDTITTGAAGACLQFHRIPVERKNANGTGYCAININGGLGGHSGVDINKGRRSAVKVAWKVLDAIRTNPNQKLTPNWVKGFDGIMDAYLGEVPETFEVNGVTYTPESYRDALGINTDDFIGLTSFTHHPFYQPFAIEVEDNWRWTQSWNLPLDEMMAVIDNAVENGYTVLWGGDVSEPGFTREGLAILLAESGKTSGSDQERWTGKAEEKEEKASKTLPAEEAVTQESRQIGFDNKTTTDDHGMHLYGIAKDQNGTKYYLIKNSWGETGKFKGIWYMSENFCKAKTLNIVVNKKALPKDIQKKLGIK